MIIFAVFGGGRMGQIYISALLKRSDAELRYVVVKTDSKRTLLTQRYHLHHDQVLLASNIETVFADKGVDAVIIASPTSEHEVQVKRSLESGKAVFCEKPISFNQTKVEEFFSLAKEKSLPVFCALQRRFDPSIRRIYEQSRDPSFGKIHIIKTCSRDANPPRLEYIKSSGGIFADTAIHDIDLVCWLAGELPDSVYSVATAHRPDFVEANDFDTISVTLTFPSNIIGVIDISRRAAYGYDQRVEVLGESGTCIQMTNPISTNDVILSAKGCRSAVALDDCVDRYIEAYNIELDHFIGLLKGEKPLIRPVDVISMSKVAAAAEQSAREKRVLRFD